MPKKRRSRDDDNPADTYSPSSSDPPLEHSLLLFLAVLVFSPKPSLFPFSEDTPGIVTKMNMDHFLYQSRAPGLRWRDDDELIRLTYGQRWMNEQSIIVRPLLTENVNNNNNNNNHRPQQLNTPTHQWTTEQPVNVQGNNNQDPSLMDFDLIDILWRNDVDMEKGNTAMIVGPSEQYERDLHLLTEKSFNSPLTAEENWQFENLSKYLYDDFYPWNGNSDSSGNGKSSFSSIDEQRRYSSINQEACADDGKSRSEGEFYMGNGSVEEFLMDKKNELRTPTDAELDALLEDVAKGGELERLGERRNDPLLNVSFEHQPILHHNVSLADAMAANNTNGTDTMLNAFYAPFTANIAETDDISSWWPEQESTSAVHYHPMANDPMNDQRVPSGTTSPDYPNNDMALFESLGGVVDSSPIRKTNVQPSRAGLLSPSTSRSTTINGWHPDTWTVTNGSSSSFNHDSAMGDSRLVGKLIPYVSEVSDEEEVEEEEEELTVRQSGPRRRGRQSKDEQLANRNGLPVSAAQISAMSLAELQRLLRDPSLTEAQRQLMRKIRRRGKNKLAARSCRQRRGVTMAVLETETSQLADELANEINRNEQLVAEVRREREMVEEMERRLDL